MSGDRLRRAYAEELKRGYLKSGFKQGFEAGYAKAKEDFDRPHGEWIPKDVHNCWTRFECSVCGYYHQPVHDFGESKPDFNFCPNCGAPMTEKAFRKYNGLKEGD